MSDLNVRGFGAEAYVSAMADVMPVPAWQPFRRIARDLTVRTCCEELAETPEVEFGIYSSSSFSRAATEDYLRDQVYGAWPVMLMMLWPLLQPLIMEVIRRLIAYWRDRPEAVRSIKAAARGGS